MTVINVFTANHGARQREGLGDILRPVMSGLRQCGVECVESDEISDSALNLVVEGGDRLPANKRYGVICTESISSMRVERFLGLKTLMMDAEFVWYLQDDRHIGLCPRAHALTLRWDEASAVPLLCDERPHMDFCGFGNVTEGRLLLVAQLAECGFRVSWPKRIVSEIERSAMVRNSRFVIGWGTIHEPERPSASRVWAAVHLGRAIVPPNIDTLSRVRLDDWCSMAHAQAWLFAQQGIMRDEMRRLAHKSGILGS